MLVWRHGSTLRPCKCPLCRRPISLLVPSEETVRSRNDATVSEVLHDVETYNRVFGGQSSGLIQRMQDLPFLLRRLLREMMDPQRTLPLVIRARVYIALILSAIYIISPIDIIPEGNPHFISSVYSYNTHTLLFYQHITDQYFVSISCQESWGLSVY
jgi:RING finger protein 170